MDILGMWSNSDIFLLISATLISLIIHIFMALVMQG
jgi:hypothetical protein